MQRPVVDLDDAGTIMAILLGIVTLVELADDDEEEALMHHPNMEAVAQAVVQLLRTRRSGTEQGNATRVRAVNAWDHERARVCVNSDYFGPSPLFNDRQFERFFRISRGIADNLLDELEKDVFERCFTDPLAE